MEKNILRIIDLNIYSFHKYFMSKIPKYLFQIMKYNVWESKLARFLTIDHGKYKEQFSYLISTFFY